jgi:hypothetical protein
MLPMKWNRKLRNVYNPYTHLGEQYEETVNFYLKN